MNWSLKLVVQMCCSPSWAEVKCHCIIWCKIVTRIPSLFYTLTAYLNSQLTMSAKKCILRRCNKKIINSLLSKHRPFSVIRINVLWRLFTVLFLECCVNAFQGTKQWRVIYSNNCLKGCWQTVFHILCAGQRKKEEILGNVKRSSIYVKTDL